MPNRWQLPLGHTKIESTVRYLGSSVRWVARHQEARRIEHTRRIEHNRTNAAGDQKPGKPEPVVTDLVTESDLKRVTQLITAYVTCIDSRGHWMAASKFLAFWQAGCPRLGASSIGWCAGCPSIVSQTTTLRPTHQGDLEWATEGMLLAQHVTGIRQIISALLA